MAIDTELGYSLGARICEAMGVDPTNVRRLVLDCQPDTAVRAHIERYITQADSARVGTEVERTSMACDGIAEYYQAGEVVTLSDAGPFVIECDQNAPCPTPEVMEALRAQLADAIEDVGSRIVIMPHGYHVRCLGTEHKTERLLSRLMLLLGMTPQERAFLNELPDPKPAQPVWSVVADWLEDRGRREEAARMREVATG